VAVWPLEVAKNILEAEKKLKASITGKAGEIEPWLLQNVNRNS